MNNRNKIHRLASFIVVLTGLLCLEVGCGVTSIGTQFYWQGIKGSGVDVPWIFEIKGVVFGLLERPPRTIMVFANYSFWVDRNIVVVAGELVVIPVIYAVFFSWIIQLRRGMKAQSPGAGSAERPV